MKIIVTGGAGFIGSNVVDELVDRNHKVLVIDNLSSGSRGNINKKAQFRKADIRNRILIPKIFAAFKPEAIFHFAAQMNVRRSVADPLFDAENNILGSLNLLEASVRNKVKKVIFSSTGGAIYGDTKIIPTPENAELLPVCPYGVAKLAVEKYLNYYHEVFGLNYTVLRFANVYGPRQNPKGEAGVVAIFCRKIRDNEKPIINGSGKQTRDYIFVADLVRANILALKSKKTATYNIATGKETSVNEIFDEINEYFGNKHKTFHGPAPKGEQQRSCLDCKKIKRELGWQPKVALEDGIKITARWFAENK